MVLAARIVLAGWVARVACHADLADPVDLAALVGLVAQEVARAGCAATIAIGLR